VQGFLKDVGIEAVLKTQKDGAYSEYRTVCRFSGVAPTT